MKVARFWVRESATLVDERGREHSTVAWGWSSDSVEEASLRRSPRQNGLSVGLSAPITTIQLRPPSINTLAADRREKKFFKSFTTPAVKRSRRSLATSTAARF